MTTKNEALIPVHCSFCNAKLPTGEASILARRCCVEGREFDRHRELPLMFKDERLITEEELKHLIRCSKRDNFLSCAFGQSIVRLNDEPGNVWAMEELLRLRRR